MQIVSVLLPDPASLFGQARLALGTASDVLLTLFIDFFVGLNPAAYRRGLESLLPRNRRRLVLAVVDDMADMLRRWLVGQVITIFLVAVSIALALMALGTPGAAVLGLLAGLLNFIPYRGSFLGAVPIAIAASSQGGTMVAWVMAIYLLIQIVEGYVLTPLVERRMVHIQPAHTPCRRVTAFTVSPGWNVYAISLAFLLRAIAGSRPSAWLRAIGARSSGTIPARACLYCLESQGFRRGLNSDSRCWLDGGQHRCLVPIRRTCANARWL